MKYVFLDRDGVINENRPDHVKTWGEFVFLPGALDALRALHLAGWHVIVITNQAVINRRLVPQTTVDEINQRMVDTIARHGGHIDAVLYCPHRPDEGCACRKPQPGLLLQAADRFHLVLPQCYVIGDAFTDIAAGQAVGCRTVLVETGRGRQQLASANKADYRPFHVAPDVGAATRWLMRVERWQAARLSLSHRRSAIPSAWHAFLPRLAPPTASVSE